MDASARPTNRGSERRRTRVMETSGSDQIPGAAGTSSDALPKHTMIGEFEIVGIIGEGGFGTVYLAIDHSLQRKVALKEYRPAMLATRHGKSVMVRSQRHADAFEAGLKSFINEARTLARFDHPALIHVYRVWQQNNTAYMAMPLCEGKSLTMMIRDSPHIATQSWVMSMMMPLLEAVSTLHASNIYHRDISPDNVLIQDNGTPMLLDFGAARHISTDRTQALTVILKPGYAPIEQFADDPSMKQGPWTDIYAIGATMYFAITGRAPPNSVARLAGDPLAPLAATMVGGYSKEFVDAIDKALAVRPGDRPQSIAEFRALLERIPEPVIPRTTTPGTVVGSLSADGTGGNGDWVATPTAPRSTEPTPAASQTVQLRAPALDEDSKSAASTGAGAVEAMRGAGDRAADAIRTVRGWLDPMIHSRRGLAIGAGAAALLVVVLAVTLVRNPFAPLAPASEDTDRSGVAGAASTPSTGAPDASAPRLTGSAAQPGDSLAGGATTTGAAATGAAATGAGTSAVPGAAPTAAGPGVAAISSGSSGQPGAPGAAGAGTPAQPAQTAGGASTGQAPTVVSGVDAPSATGGTLAFSIRPWGEVIVNGESKGPSPPLKRVTLPEGTHKVEVVNPGFPSFSIDVQVARNKSTTVTHQFK